MNIYLHKDKKNISIHSSQGFSLVEVLVALAIFSFSILGIVDVIYSGGVSIAGAKNRLIANYLAQEGIEIVRAKRDSYVLANPTNYVAGWNAFVNNVNQGCGGGASCDIDVGNLVNLGPSSGNQFISCGTSIISSSQCGFWYSQDGFYLHNLTTTTGTKTPFIRGLIITPHMSSDGTSVTELEVTSTVYWKEGSVYQSISMNESLFNWYATQ